MTDLFSPLTLASGATMKNRLMLAPLTNTQSHADGTLSDAEFHWLTMRAEGGFGLTMTCAAHVQRRGQGFPGQLGIWSDDHLPGLKRLADKIKAEGSVAVVQLHHAGVRSPKDLIGETPVGPSDHADTGSRALSLEEVHQLRDDFIAGAVRAEKAGFDGVELHGAHGYIICAFLSPGLNKREDAYGGSAENRARLLNEIIDGVRAATKPGFTLGVRLSPERFDLDMGEIRDLAGAILTGGKVDFLDMSLWDVFMEPGDERFKGKRLIDIFAELPRKGCVLGVAGKVRSAKDARACLEAGVDYALIGRAAILHHDWPKKAAANPDFEPVATPVPASYLAAEGVSPVFVSYLDQYFKMVAKDAA